MLISHADHIYCCLIPFLPVPPVTTSEGYCLICNSLHNTSDYKVIILFVERCLFVFNTVSSLSLVTIVNVFMITEIKHN